MRQRFVNAIDRVLVGETAIDPLTGDVIAASDHALADLSSRLTNLDAQGMPTVDTWLVDGFEVKFNYDPLADPAHMFQLREALIPKDFVRPTPSVIPLLTPLDRALHAADKGALETLARDFVLSDKPTMPTAVPERVAIKVVKNAPAARPSTRYARKLAETDGTASPSAAILDAPNNRIGVDALSWLNHGVSGTQPATINGVVALLRRIEDGYPRKAGMGDGVAAEAQRVANEILDAAVKDRPKGDTTGIFTKGQFPDDEVALADQLHNLLTYDQSNPLGTLQYGLAKRPQAAVVLEWSRVVPGLAEELMSKRFMPYTERVWNTHTREAFNWIFGPRSNAAIRAESEMRFLQRAAAEGVDGTIAKEIHSAWRKMALESRSKTILKSKTGEMKATLGDNPLYADVHNIPNSALQAEALTVVDKLLADGKVSNLDNYAKTLRSVNYDRLFREAGSFTRRHLDDAGNGPLGPALAQAYGMVAHNKAITTLYYQFRFAMDVRFHAMNYMEAQFLYTGRAGAKPGEIDQGMFGYNGDYLRSMGADAASNTGYAFSHDRHSWAYRTFLKEQPDAMRKALKGLQSEDPAMMRKALKQMAQHDPQLQNMIQKFDGTTDPTKYLKELNDWHGKMLNNATLDETAMVIDQSIADALVGSPELAQVYAKLGEVNKNLWDDVRQTFYGNPDRSRAERFLNSYLLYWPLSYQIKSTKWFAKILFDRAGGIQTNALGAVLVDRMATTHQQLLATDPQYKDWFEKNKTLVFLAQMLFPVSFESTGVSMSPFLRDSFFGRSRAIWDIGPIYTATHVVPQVGKEIYKDLYPTLKDVPGYSEIYSMATGKAPPKVSFADAGNAPYVPPEAPVPLTPAKAPNSP